MIPFWLGMISGISISLIFYHTKLFKYTIVTLGYIILLPFEVNNQRNLKRKTLDILTILWEEYRGLMRDVRYGLF